LISGYPNGPTDKKRNVPCFAFVGYAPGIPSFLNIVAMPWDQRGELGNNTIPYLFN